MASIHPLPLVKPTAPAVSENLTPSVGGPDFARLEMRQIWVEKDQPIAVPKRYIDADNDMPDVSSIFTVAATLVLATLDDNSCAWCSIPGHGWPIKTNPTIEQQMDVIGKAAIRMEESLVADAVMEMSSDPQVAAMRGRMGNAAGIRPFLKALGYDYTPKVSPAH